MAIESRIAEIISRPLGAGSHKSIEHGMCVMEAVSYVAGEPWSDSPSCTCPVIGAFMRTWNDGLLSDADRDRLLRPLIPQLVGTRSTKEAEERRAFLAMDWFIRVSTPAWLDNVDALKPHAAALRSLEEIADAAGLVAAHAALSAARDTAWDTAWDTAGNVAWATAGNAAWAAAWEAAQAAAWDTAWDAARVAAWDAARVAAWDAARVAAWDATTAALRPTTERLQESALDLVMRMIAVQPRTEAA